MNAGSWWLLYVILLGSSLHAQSALGPLEPVALADIKPTMESAGVRGVCASNVGLHVLVTNRTEAEVIRIGKDGQVLNRFRVGAGFWSLRCGPDGRLALHAPVGQTQHKKVTVYDAGGAPVGVSRNKGHC